MIYTNVASDPSIHSLGVFAGHGKKAGTPAKEVDISSAEREENLRRFVKQAHQRAGVIYLNLDKDAGKDKPSWGV